LRLSISKMSTYRHTLVCQFMNQALKCHPSNEFLLHTFPALHIYSVLDARKQLLNAWIQSSHNRLNWFPTPTTTIYLFILFAFICTTVGKTLRTWNLSKIQRYTRLQKITHL
jgi:hypothetical protein